MERVHLTFDDGPDPRYTPRILDLLKDAGMTATFFVTGPHLAAHPGLVQRIHDEGHAVGGHAHRHVRHTEETPSAWEESILPVQARLTELLGTPCHLFRPPYGDTDEDLQAWCEKQGLEVVLWDRDATDWDEPSPEEIVKRLLTGAGPGDVLLLHDAHHAYRGSREQTVEAVRLLLPALRELGLPSAALDEKAAKEAARHRAGAEEHEGAPKREGTDERSPATEQAKPCPFCTLVLPGLERPLLAETEHVVAFEDAYPSAHGHTLVIPRRHVGRVLDLTDAEYEDLFKVARDQLVRLEEAGPESYTIGINDGPAAGQTVPHVHLHLIPRNAGDTEQAKGGVRWVIPETAPYWEK